MTEKRLTINDLKKQLGSEYTIRTIDYERCLYRDFGNGFNVEISGVDSRKRHRKLSLYLWLGDTLMNCIIAETIHDVECTSDAITSLCSFRGASWRVPYIIAAGSAVVACVSFAVIGKATFGSSKASPDTPPDGESAPKDSVQVLAIPKGRSIVALLAASGALVFLIPVVFHGMLKDGVIAWVPNILKDTYGTTASLSTALAVLLPLANLCGSLISNALFLHVFKRNHAATGACVMLLAAVPTALVINTKAMPLFAGVICLAVLSMLMSGFNYLFSTLVPSLFSVYGRTATVSGIFNSAIYAGSAVSMYLFAKVQEMFSWSATIALWLGLTVASAVVLLIMIRPWRRFLDTLPEERD